jgi:hypothetical protein
MYEVEAICNDIAFIPNSVKIGHLVQKLEEKHTHSMVIS